MKSTIGIVTILLFLVSCSVPERKLPFLGNPVVTDTDTIYPVISSFAFIDQDSAIVTSATFDNKIYIADFIFLSCPTICPVMTNEMNKVYTAFKTNPNVYFLSHTIDPEHDSISRLKAYAGSLGIRDKKWLFVTGDKKEIYRIANESYFATAYADSLAPGGYVHSGGILLVDKNKHIRGVYDGTNPKETTRLMTDLKILLKEQFSE